LKENVTKNDILWKDYNINIRYIKLNIYQNVARQKSATEMSKLKLKSTTIFH